MNFARVRNGIVTNVELWASEAEAKMSANDGEQMIEFFDDRPAYVGLRYSEADGFEQKIEPAYSSEGVLLDDPDREEQERRQVETLAALQEQVISQDLSAGRDPSAQWFVE